MRLFRRLSPTRLAAWHISFPLPLDPTVPTSEYSISIIYHHLHYKMLHYQSMSGDSLGVLFERPSSENDFAVCRILKLDEDIGEIRANLYSALDVL